MTGARAEGVDVQAFADIMRTHGAVMPSRERTAALYLDSLALHDRDWLLAALPQQQGQRLTHLLADLASSGLSAAALRPGSGKWPGPAAQTDSAPRDARPEREQVKRNTFSGSAECRFLHRLNGAQQRRLFVLLQGEPLPLSAMLLHAASASGVSSWPWQQRLLASLPPTRRRRLETLLRNGEATPVELAQQLMRTLCAELKPGVFAIPARAGEQQKSLHGFLPVLSAWTAGMESAVCRMMSFWRDKAAARRHR